MTLEDSINMQTSVQWLQRALVGVVLAEGDLTVSACLFWKQLFIFSTEGAIVIFASVDFVEEQRSRTRC